MATNTTKFTLFFPINSWLGLFFSKIPIPPKKFLVQYQMSNVNVLFPGSWIMTPPLALFWWTTSSYNLGIKFIECHKYINSSILQKFSLFLTMFWGAAPKRWLKFTSLVVGKLWTTSSNFQSTSENLGWKTLVVSTFF